MNIRRPLVWLLFSYIAGIGLYNVKLFFIYFIAIFLSIIITIWLAYLIYKCSNRKNGSNNSGKIKNSIDWKDKSKVLMQYCFLYGIPILLILGHRLMNQQIAPLPMDKVFKSQIIGTITGQLDMIQNKGDNVVLTLRENTITFDSNVKFYCNKIIVYTNNTSSSSSSDTSNHISESSLNNTSNNISESSLNIISNNNSNNILESSYKIGNVLSVTGQIKKFKKATNPGQFDEKQYNQMQNIDYKMYAKNISIVNPKYSAFYNTIYNAKLKFIEVFYSILPTKEAGIISAMILGENSLLDEDIKELYQQNGISHILAISGLHITLIGISIYRLLCKLKIPLLPNTIISIGFIFTYGVLTNFSVSTNRSIVMLIVMMIAKVIGRTYDILTATSLSALIILIQSPLQIINAGFLLSFGAILGIAVIYPVLCKIINLKNKIVEGIILSFSIQCITLPVILYYFYEVPVYSILINMILVPLSSIIILLAIIAGIVGCFFIPLGLFTIGGAHYILRFYEYVCRIGSSLPYNLYLTGRPSLLQIITYLLVLLIFLLMNTKELQKKSIIVLCFLVIIFINPQNPNLNVTFLDVGQGDGIFVQMPNGKNYLIDGGSADVKNLGRYRLKPFLKSQGIGKLDYAIITHPDKDHISGLEELIMEGEITIKHVMLPDIAFKDNAYLELIKTVELAKIEIVYINQGDVIKEGQVQITCLHPSETFQPTTSNSYSTVLSVKYGGFDMLLTGDLESAGEQLLIDQFKNSELTSYYDFLKVSHHGSKYSTSMEFLDVVKPKISIISYGEGNRYGHPHKIVLDRLQEVRSGLYTTAEQGAIHIQTDGESYFIKGYCD